MSEFKNKFLKQLLKDTDEGLSARQKYLKSKYFYDARGDLLFRWITHLPEYYLSTCETEILHSCSKDILSAFNPSAEVNLVELGSGDASKTVLLLEAAVARDLKVNYYPVDISLDVLKLAAENVNSLAPVIPVAGDYTKLLSHTKFKKLSNKLILFLGSNIGNFTASETRRFMKYLNDNMKQGEHALIGFDLVKDPAVILNAYNDPTGLTSDFNMNLLTVLNNELKADFDPDNFFHAPVYDNELKAAKSYLVSNKKHKVFFESLFKSFSFEAGESIFTEISTKYTVEDIHKIIFEAGFSIVSTHTDHRKYFLDVLIAKI